MRNSETVLTNEKRICALHGCDETFLLPPSAPHKRYCCERHQRIAEKRHYRKRHIEVVRCANPRCGRNFERTTKSGRLKRITLHECRHTFASLMIAAGVNAKALSTDMGHANIAITQRASALERSWWLLAAGQG